MFLLVALSLVAFDAKAYQQIVGDPATTPAAEYKSASKSTTAGISDKIAAAGELLVYTIDGNDGLTVTRVGPGAAANAGSRLIAGVATKIVATGDSGYFLMQTKGYATVKFDATVGAQHTSAGIVRGDNLCANSVGAAVACTGAASASRVVALEAKATATTGSNLKVLINAQ